MQAKKTAIKAFGRKLRALREAKRLGLRELAKQARISPTFLSQVEHGRATPPAAKKLNALADALDCSADELMMLAGRLPGDVLEIIQRHPREYLGLVRDLGTKNAEDLERIRLGVRRPLLTEVENLFSGPEQQPKREHKSALQQILQLIDEHSREKQEVK